MVHVNGSLGGACVIVVAVISLSLSEQFVDMLWPGYPVLEYAGYQQNIL